MRRSYGFAYVIVGLSSFLCLATSVQAQDVVSRISAVTVYQQGAWVTRSAQVNLQQGDNSLAFKGLSAQINQRQLRVAVDAKGVVLGQISFDEVQQRDAFDAQVRALQIKIDEVGDHIAGLEDASQTAQLKLRFLDGIAQGYAKETWFEGARGNADVGSWRTALSVLDEGSQAARTTLRENAKAIRDAKQDLSQLEREMQSLRGRSRVSTDITVTVASPAVQRATIELRYFQSYASWTPHYTAYVDSETLTLKLNQKGLVMQQTDEDWRNVQLSLSTSAPSGELIAPPVNSEFLQLIDPQQVRMSAAPQVQKRSASLALADSEVAAEQGQAAPDIGQYTISYRVPGQVNVTKDSADAASFDLSDMSFAVKLLTHIVPRLSEQAFLAAKFTYDQTLPLYGQSLQVYVDQEYVGETWLPTALPEDVITLPAGQDRRVELVVQNQGGRTDESGFIGRRKSELTANLFSLTNRRKGVAEVEVYDRYPTAINDDIQVSIPKSATPPSERDIDKKPGVIVWRKTLAAGETWEILHAYEVSYPADKQIIANPG